LMFTERGIYRPGDVVKVKGIVRRETDGGNALVKDRSLRLELYTPESELLTTYTLKTNTFGTFAADVRVPAGAALGGWRLSVAGSEVQISTDFQVAEYRPAEFKVQVQSDKPEYRRGQTAAFEIRGDYLFGAPMPGADLRYSISRGPSAFFPPNADGFVTDAALYYSSLEDESPASGVLGNGGVKLDASGRFTLAQPLTLPNQRGPELVSVDAEVTDLSRQSIASSTTSIVHASDVYVALAPLDDMFVKAPGAVRPKLLTLTSDGRRVAGRSVKLELLQRRWTIARVQAGSDVRSESKIVDSVVGGCMVQSALEPRSCELTVPQAGYYLILATAKDKLGGQAQAAIDVYGLGKGSVSWPDNDSRQVELVLDKKQYRVGETARVLVKSPFPQAEALLTVETGSVRSERRVVLSGPTPTLDVPVTEAFRPNAFVSIHLLRGRSAPAPAAPGKPDVGAPTYRFGYAELKVDAEARRLKVDIKPRRRDLRPGAEAQVDVRVTRSDGTPERAELTLYAVDEGVLSLVGYRVPDPLQTFTEPRPLRTATLEARSSLARSGLLAFAELLGLEKGAAGGGGGEGAIGARRDFRQTAYYNASLVTAADGTASVSFRLPDTLTTFRVMGVATSQEDRYGHGQSTLTTSKPLMARPALPRLLRAGDTLQASLIVSAKDFGPAEADVSLKATGVTLSGPSSQRVKLARNASVEVRFPLSAPLTTEAKFRFDVRALREHDAVEVVRRVDNPAQLEAVALYGSTDGASAERLGDLSTIRRDVGGLDVSVASTALVGLDQGFEQLAEYPYGCTEQLSSRLLPLLPLAELARDFGFDPPKDTKRSIESSLGEILRRQRGDGGFAMWPESEESSAWVSPYTLWVLFEAKRHGAVVPSQALDRGRDYLRRQLERAERDPVDRATRAFVLFVLARLGAPDPGYESRLFAERKTLPIFARALLLEAMLLSKNDPKSRDTLARELEGAVKLVADRAVVTEDLGDDYASVMDSDARTSAITLAALVAYRPAHALGARLARGLLAARRGGAWRSTQETAFALLALNAYRKAQERAEPNFVARVWLGGKRLVESAFRGRSTEAREHFIAASGLSGGDLVFDKDGTGQLFYAARLRYARTRLPSSALDRGFYVQKTLRAVSPGSLRTALGKVPAQGEQRFAPGALVLADVIVVTPAPRDYVVLDDPLPAGFEAVDTRLSTTAAWLRVPGDEVATSDDEIAEGNARLASSYRQELRDDRALFFVDHMAAGIHHYRYLARATALGRFVVPPTKAEEMYAPEVFGRTAAAMVEVQ
jgi:alpha-2-macroglobulin